MSLCFLINPQSGGMKARTFLQNINSHIETRQLKNIKVIEIDFSKIEFQLNSAKKFATIVIGGGDGTISSLLGHLKDHPRVGIIPFGTGNDLARELNIIGAFNVASAESVLEFFFKNKTRRLVLGKIEYGENFEKKTHFTNYISFGFDAKVVQDFAVLRKSKIHEYFKGVWVNRLTYVYSGISNLNVFLKSSSILNQDTNESIKLKSCRSIYFTNIRSVMGMGVLTKTSTPFDDKIEFVLIKNIFQYLSLIIGKFLPWFLPKANGSSSNWILKNESENFFVQVDGDPIDIGVSKIVKISTGDFVNIVVGLELET